MGSPPLTVWGLMKLLCEFHDLITFPAVLAPNRAVMGRGTLLASPVIVGAARRPCISCKHCPSLEGFMQEPERMEGRRGQGHPTRTFILSCSEQCFRALRWARGMLARMNWGPQLGFFKHMKCGPRIMTPKPHTSIRNHQTLKWVPWVLPSTCSPGPHTPTSWILGSAPTEGHRRAHARHHGHTLGHDLGLADCALVPAGASAWRSLPPGDWA